MQKPAAVRGKDRRLIPALQEDFILPVSGQISDVRLEPGLRRAGGELGRFGDRDRRADPLPGRIAAPAHADRPEPVLMRAVNPLGQREQPRARMVRRFRRRRIPNPGEGGFGDCHPYPRGGVHPAEVLAGAGRGLENPPSRRSLPHAAGIPNPSVRGPARGSRPAYQSSGFPRVAAPPPETNTPDRPRARSNPEAHPTRPDPRAGPGQGHTPTIQRRRHPRRSPGTAAPHPDGFSTRLAPPQAHPACGTRPRNPGSRAAGNLPRRRLIHLRSAPAGAHRALRTRRPQCVAFQHEASIPRISQKRRGWGRPSAFGRPEAGRFSPKRFSQGGAVDSNLARVVSRHARCDQGLGVGAAQQSVTPALQSGPHLVKQRRIEPAQRVDQRAGEHQIDFNPGMVAEHIQNAAVADAAGPFRRLAQGLVKEETKCQAKGHLSLYEDGSGGIIPDLTSPPPSSPLLPLREGGRGAGASVLNRGEGGEGWLGRVRGLGCGRRTEKYSHKKHKGHIEKT